jgi:uncharacterized repeat protein (TIGR01451 family)
MFSEKGLRANRVFGAVASAAMVFGTLSGALVLTDSGPANASSSSPPLQECANGGGNTHTGYPNYGSSTGNCKPVKVDPAAVALALGANAASVTANTSSSPASGSVVAAGSTVVYTIALTNSGQTDATGVTVTDAVPSGTTFVSAIAGGTNSGGTVAWTGLTVPAGGSTSVSFTVTVNSTDTGMTINNVADFTNVNDSNCPTPTCPTNAVSLVVPTQPVLPSATSVPAPTTTMAPHPRPATTPTTTTTVAPTTTTVAPTTTTVAPTTTTVAHPALAFTGAYLSRLAIAGAAAIGTGLIVFMSSNRRKRRTTR